MLCSADFSSPFELRPLAEHLTPNELQELFPLFAAIAPPAKLKLCNRIGSGFRARAAKTARSGSANPFNGSNSLEVFCATWSILLRAVDPSFGLVRLNATEASLNRQGPGHPGKEIATSTAVRACVPLRGCAHAPSANHPARRDPRTSPYRAPTPASL